jgi:ribosomal protein S12 methylthiotransferase
MSRTFWVETLGCPKNQVDSDKLTGTMLADGLVPASSAQEADLVGVNTCAFVEEARQESIDTVLTLSDQRRPDAEIVVTGCLAERYGDELAEAMPEVDAVVGFGIPVSLTTKPTNGAALPSFDLLNLPRPRSATPWAYVKVAEGCDRNCGFCAIPSFRGKQRSRGVPDLLAEVEALDVREIVLVAQDLAAFGRDQGQGERQIVPLVKAVAERVDWVRLLYLYPSDLTDELIGAILDTGVPYFDLSLQHVSRPLMRRMRRWGDGERFLARIAEIRAQEASAVFRSNFIVGYPGETEDDHDQLLEFVHEAQLDWCGFFSYSREEGTYGAELDGVVAPELMAERLGELSAMQDEITAARRDQLIGTRVRALVDTPGEARSHREAPEIDGLILVPDHLPVGQFVDLTVVDALGPDLVAESIGVA